MGGRQPTFYDLMILGWDISKARFCTWPPLVSKALSMNGNLSRYIIKPVGAILHFLSFLYPILQNSIPAFYVFSALQLWNSDSLYTIDMPINPHISIFQRREKKAKQYNEMK